MHLAFVLIPSDYFKFDIFNDDIDMQQANEDKVLVLIEQHSDVWINVS